MGPEPESAEKPRRPRFQWDTRSPPWTDGKGNQEGYLRAVKLWKEFHDALPDSNSNKIPKKLQGIILKSQLFGRAQDLVANIHDEDLKAEDGALTIASAVHKVDALSQVNNMSEQFSKLLDTLRSDTEQMKAFEARFQAQVCKFHEAPGSAVLPESLLALMLMKNAHLENRQRVSVLASVAPSENNQLNSEALQSAVKYEKVASIIRSSDAPKQGFKTISGHSANTAYNNKKDSIKELKKTRLCAECGQLGHWYKDDICPKKKGGGSDFASHSGNKRRTVSFN